LKTITDPPDPSLRPAVAFYKNITVALSGPGQGDALASKTDQQKHKTFWEALLKIIEKTHYSKIWFYVNLLTFRVNQACLPD